MVKVNELRIDNWILWNPRLIHPNVIFEPMQVQVTALLPGKIGYVTPSVEHRVEPFEDTLLETDIPYWPLEEFEAITLTAEWLQKFEFTKTTGIAVAWVSQEKNGFQMVLQDDFHFPLSPEQTIQIQYVHQLQNLYYALTGEEIHDV